MGMAGILFVFFFCVFFNTFFLDTNYFTDNMSHEDPNDDNSCHVTNTIDDNMASIFLFFFLHTNLFFKIVIN